MILKTGIGARAALGELKTAGELIPNPAILINMIPLLEARTSSEIENRDDRRPFIPQQGRDACCGGKG